MASLLFTQLLIPARAAPVNNPPTYAPPWVEDPDTRGTWSLLYSCLFTLGLCVWSAIHLNIPKRGEPPSRQFWRKVKWVFIAILAPEVVLFCAWHQFYTARQLCLELNYMKFNDEVKTDDLKTWTKRFLEDIIKLKCANTFWRYGKKHVNSIIQNVRHLNYLRPSKWSEWNKYRNEKKAGKEASKRSRFSLTYGYYVVMGGLIVDVKDLDDDAQFLTLTPVGVLDLAKKVGYSSVEVPDDATRDKSKADNLGKVLIIFQVGWTVLQTISRGVLKYPLTALEVHILVHAICALMMYIIWIPKPFDVRESTIIDSSDIKDELALQLIRSPGRISRKVFQQLGDLQPETKYVYQNGQWIAQDATEAEVLVFDMSRINVKTQPCSTSLSKNHVDSNKATDKFGLTLRPMDTTASILNIETGMTLMNGIGPGAVYGGEAAEHNITPIEGEFRRMLLPYSRRDSRFRAPLIDSVKVYPISIALSAKDLCRWEHAGRALQRELAAIKSMIAPSHSNPHTIGLGELYPISHTLSVRGIRKWENKPLQEKRIWLDIGSSRLATSETNLSLLSHLVKHLPDYTDPSVVPLVNRMANFEGFPVQNLFDSDKPNLITLYAFGIVSVAYAAVHLALWNHDFPTEIEKLLWKISACTLAVPGGIIVGLLAMLLVFCLLFIPIFLADRSYSYLKDVFGSSTRAEKTSTKTAETMIEEGVKDSEFVGDTVYSLQDLGGANATGEMIQPDAAQPDIAPIPGSRGGSQAAGVIQHMQDSAASPSLVRRIAYHEPSHLHRPGRGPGVFDFDGPSSPPSQERNESSNGRTTLAARKPPVATPSSTELGLIVFSPITAGCIALYAFSRVYVVVESFISLRKVPVGVYDNITWARYIPHL